MCFVRVSCTGRPAAVRWAMELTRSFGCTGLVQETRIPLPRSVAWPVVSLPIMPLVRQCPTAHTFVGRDVPLWSPPGGHCFERGLPGTASPGHVEPGPLVRDGGVLHVPLDCSQHWHRIIESQKNAIRGVENASKADCGPKKRHWRWYRDIRKKLRKKRKCI